MICSYEIFLSNGILKMCVFFGIYTLTRNLLWGHSYVKNILLGAVRIIKYKIRCIPFKLACHLFAMYNTYKENN